MQFLAKPLAVFIAICVATMLAIMLASLWLSQPTTRADVAVILGSKVFPDGALSPELQARLERAVELEEVETSMTYVVSGGVGIEGPDEAEAMEAFLVKSGISEDRIMADSDGINTLESVRYIANNFPVETKIIVVSQFFHIPRVVLALRKAGFKNVSGAAVPPMFLSDIYSTAREVPALFLYACCRAL